MLRRRCLFVILVFVVAAACFRQPEHGEPAGHQHASQELEIQQCGPISVSASVEGVPLPSAIIGAAPMEVAGFGAGAHLRQLYYGCIRNEIPTSSLEQIYFGYGVPDAPDALVVVTTYAPGWAEPPGQAIWTAYIDSVQPPQFVQPAKGLNALQEPLSLPGARWVEDATLFGPIVPTDETYGEAMLLLLRMRGRTRVAVSTWGLSPETLGSLAVSLRLMRPGSKAVEWADFQGRLVASAGSADE
jgi:hypothetical protein